MPGPGRTLEHLGSILCLLLFRTTDQTKFGFHCMNPIVGFEWVSSGGEHRRTGALEVGIGTSMIKTTGTMSLLDIQLTLRQQIDQLCLLGHYLCQGGRRRRRRWRLG